jgi:hypothetical protein
MGVSFISVIHHNKRSDVDALQKTLGASSLVGAVRAFWGFSRDPEDKQQHFTTLVKSNLSAKDRGSSTPSARRKSSVSRRLISYGVKRPRQRLTNCWTPNGTPADGLYLLLYLLYHQGGVR